MTTDEITAGNKSIAIFMHWKKSEYHKGYFEPPNEISSYITPMHIEDLKYNSSWDLLMPVMEKIESLGYETMMHKPKNFPRWACDITLGKNVHGLKDTATSLNPNSKIESVWRAVVLFIEWFNKKDGKEGDRAIR